MLFRIMVGAVVLFTTLCFFGCAAKASESPVQAQQMFSGELSAGSDCKRLQPSRYMASRNCFFEKEHLYLGTPDQAMFDQYMATSLSYTGEEKQSREIFDRLNSSVPSHETIDLSRVQTKSAEVEIVERVRDRQLVLINEAHHVPQTRLLTLQLLQPLYDKGFRYFAAETFNKEFLAKTIEQQFPTQETGYYTAEPTYSLIVREALKIGYRLVAYESSPKCDPFHEPPEKCQNLREEGQAKNIYEGIFKNDPHAKVLIHAGYGHIDKKGGDDN